MTATVAPLRDGKREGKKKQLETYNQGSDRHILPIKHPECPRRQPPIPLLRGVRQDFLFQEPPEHRALVALVHPRNRNRQLEVLEALNADVYRVLEAVGQEEEGGRVVYLPPC